MIIREKSTVELQVELLIDAGENYSDISDGSGVSVTTLRRISNGVDVSKKTKVKIDEYYQSELGYNS